MNLPTYLNCVFSSFGVEVNPMDVRLGKSPAVIEDVVDCVTAVIRSIVPFMKLLYGSEDPHEAYPKVVFATR